MASSRTATDRVVKSVPSRDRMSPSIPRYRSTVAAPACTHASIAAWSSIEVDDASRTAEVSARCFLYRSSRRAARASVCQMSARGNSRIRARSQANSRRRSSAKWSGRAADRLFAFTDDLDDVEREEQGIKGGDAGRERAWNAGIGVFRHARMPNIAVKAAQ